MADFLNICKEVTQNLINGFGEFWSWFINPIISIGDFTMAPYMFFSFGVIIVIFALCLGHLINPLG